MDISKYHDTANDGSPVSSVKADSQSASGTVKAGSVHNCRTDAVKFKQSKAAETGHANIEEVVVLPRLQSHARVSLNFPSGVISCLSFFLMCVFRKGPWCRSRLSMK
jgi:hypothetical protein